MNTSIRVRHALSLSAISLALLAGNVLAQSELDTRALGDPSIRVQSCNEVDIGWNLELIEQYPHIASACHEVVDNNGIKWARFEADFVRINSDGSVTSDFVDRRGRTAGRYTLIPGEGQQVTLDGRKRPFSALRPNQRISLYVPEGATSLASEPVEAPEQYAQITRYEPIAEEPAPVQLAAATSVPRMTRLPDTAGPLPWFAAGSGLFALLALGLRRFGR